MPFASRKTRFRRAKTALLGSRQVEPRSEIYCSCLDHPLKVLHRCVLHRYPRAQIELVVELGALEAWDRQNLDVMSEQRNLTMTQSARDNGGKAGDECNNYVFPRRLVEVDQIPSRE